MWVGSGHLGTKKKATFPFLACYNIPTRKFLNEKNGALRSMSNQDQ